LAWDWQVFCKETTSGDVVAGCFGRGGDITYLNWILSAWGWTLSVAALALVVALLVGSLMGILRTVPDKRLVLLGNAWTELFRNIPLLVQIFLWYHVLPAIFLSLRALPSFVLVVFALGFFTSARISEQVKAGIQALPKGQRYAGLAMGLTLPQTYRYVLLPMAFRIVIPPLTSETMNLIKNSSIALTIGLAELTFRSREMGEYTFNFFEAFTAATVIYIVIAMSANRIMAFIERRVAVPGYIGGGK
jgi:glutamate/aspartate transport system permease protein